MTGFFALLLLAAAGTMTPGGMSDERSLRASREDPRGRTLDEQLTRCVPAAPGGPERPLDGACLRSIAVLGAAGARYVDKVLAFAHSPSMYERAHAATALGMIGYRAAIPQLQGGLASDGWAVVFASARSLGWLRATAARDDLARVARTHWYDAVRREASIALDTIDGGREPSEPNRSAAWGEPGEAFDFVPFDRAKSGCRTWQWRGKTASPHRYYDALIADIARTLKREPAPGVRYVGDALAILPVDGGRLIAVPDPEGIGQFYYQATGAEARKLFDANILALQRTPDGIVGMMSVVEGVLQVGRLVSIERDGADGFSYRRRLHLPGRVGGVIPLGDDEFLLPTGAGAFVLRSGWRLEQATCAEPGG